MKKFLLVTTLVSTLVTSQAAHAGGNPWPFVGGLFAGAILNEAINHPRYDHYQRYNNYQRYDYPMDQDGPVVICFKRPVYDESGYQVGWRRVCQQN